MQKIASRDSTVPVDADPMERALSDALEVWASWLRSGRWVDGYPDHSPMFGSAHTGMDWEEWESNVDSSLAQAVDAAVSDLSECERAAVFSVKVASVYRLREPIQIVYLRARCKLRAALVRRGALVA